RNRTSAFVPALWLMNGRSAKADRPRSQAPIPMVRPASAIGADPFGRPVARQGRFVIAIFGDGLHHFLRAQEFLLRRVELVEEILVFLAKTDAGPVERLLRHGVGVG